MGQERRENERGKGKGKGHNIGWESKAPRTTDYNSTNTPQPARDCEHIERESGDTLL